jgi:hypothetical protein
MTWGELIYLTPFLPLPFREGGPEGVRLIESSI